MSKSKYPSKDSPSREETVLRRIRKGTQRKGEGFRKLPRLLFQLLLKGEENFGLSIGHRVENLEGVGVCLGVEG